MTKRSPDHQQERVRKMAARRNLRLIGDQGTYWLMEEFPERRTVLANTTLAAIETYLLTIPVANANS